MFTPSLNFLVTPSKPAVNRVWGWGLRSCCRLAVIPNSDGSYTIRFGGCTASTVNCLPIMDGWNYAVRMYQPSKAIIDGSWTYPSPPTPRKD